MDKTKRYTRNSMGFLEKIEESLGEITVAEDSGELGGLTDRNLSQEIEQNPEISDAADISASASVVAVCVEKNSEPAVLWALDSLVSEGEKLKLIHVRRPIVTLPTPMGNRLPIALASSDAVAAHMKKVASQTLNLLRPFQQMCNSKKVQAENIVLDDHNIRQAIEKYISDSGVNKLVMMSSHPLIKRQPAGLDSKKLKKGDDKGHDSRKLKDNDKGHHSMKLKDGDKGRDSMKLKDNDKGHDSMKLKGNDMPESIAMKPSKFCSVYVISKGKHGSGHPSNTSARDSGSSSCSSEDNSLSREMTGKSVLEPSETTTNNENGGESLENSRRDFDGPFISEHDIETKLERPKIELQHTGETYKEAIVIEEAIVANENGNQSLQNNRRDFEGPFI